MVFRSGYLKLCSKVHKINPEAARFMVEEAPSPSNRWNFSPSNTLSGSFHWGATPQGHEYWKSLSREYDRLYHE